MLIGDNNRFDKKKIVQGFMLVNKKEEKTHTSYVDRIPERYKKCDYLIEKIYDPKEGAGIL